MRPSRALLVALVLVIAVPIQTAILGRFALLGAKPELLILIVVAMGLLHGSLQAAAAGAFAGLLFDSLTALPDGLGILVLTSAGAAVGRLRPLLQRPSAWIPPLTVGIATIASLSVYALLALMVGSPVGAPLRTASRIFFAGIYGAVLTPFVYPLLQRLVVDRPREVIGSVLVRR